MADTKKGKPIILFFALVLLAGAAGAAFFAFQMLKNKDRPTYTFAHVKLKPEIIDFTYQMWPSAYAALVDLDTELGLITKETERMAQMENTFPQQRNIILSEKTIWDRAQKKTTTTLQNLEKEVEAVYVTYSVNNTKGMQLLEDTRDSILNPANELLVEIRPMTEHLKIKKDESILGRIKNMIASDE